MISTKLSVSVNTFYFIILISASGRSLKFTSCRGGWGESCRGGWGELAQGAPRRFTQWPWVEHPTFRLRGQLMFCFDFPKFRSRVSNSYLLLCRAKTFRCWRKNWNEARKISKKFPSSARAASCLTGITTSKTRFCAPCARQLLIGDKASRFVVFFFGNSCVTELELTFCRWVGDEELLIITIKNDAQNYLTVQRHRHANKCIFQSFVCRRSVSPSIFSKNWSNGSNWALILCRGPGAPACLTGSDIPFRSYG